MTVQVELQQFPPDPGKLPFLNPKPAGKLHVAEVGEMVEVLVMVTLISLAELTLVDPKFVFGIEMLAAGVELPVKLRV